MSGRRNVACWSRAAAHPDDAGPSLVPVNTRWMVVQVLDAANHGPTGRRITIESALIRALSALVWRADTLAEMPRGVRQARVRRAVGGVGTPVTVRDTRGREVDGACGQLAVCEG